MDAIQFGRWVADRRRDGGWASQRALALAAQNDPRTGGLAISEAFVSRLEAGLLVHPFRGGARRRVIGLAWLLCTSARQVRTFVKHAELGSLGRAEAAELDSLVRSLSDSHPRHLVVVPPPPATFVGRSGELATLTAALTQAGPSCTIVTGMPGIGKTSLALVAAHQLATGGHGPAPFSDGIHFMSCAGRHGADGACGVLEDVLALQQPHDQAAAGRRHAVDARAAGAHDDDASRGALALARIADHLRQTLADKRLLVILDGIEPDLPLDAVLAALMPVGFSRSPTQPAGADTLIAPSVLITSRYLPPVASRVHHLHLHPLALEDGVRLIECTMGRATAFDGEDRGAALRLCAAVGGVPQAIEAAAATLALTGIPLALLAAAAERNPLTILGTTGMPDHAGVRSLDALPAELRTQLALLSVLQAESFGLDAAAALRPQSPASAAILAGDLVRHSLLEPEPPMAAERNASRAGSAGMPTTRDAHFRLPPLLRAYAAEQARSLSPDLIASARRNLGAYAADYVEQYSYDPQALAAEADVLRAALRYAIRDGEHERTVRLVRGLLPLALRRDTCGDIERLVLAGVRAGKAIADRHALEPLLNMLGIMRFYQGDNARARRAWMQGMQVGGDLRAMDRYHGFGYLNLAQLADLEGEPDAAWHLAEVGVHYCRRAGDAAIVAAALTVQAERARRRGEQHIAHAYARESLDLAGSSAINQAWPDSPNLYLIEAGMQMARIERDHVTAIEYAEQYLALADTRHRLFIAEALVDQAECSLEADTNQDSLRLAGHVLAIADAAHATALSRRARAVQLRAERTPRRWQGSAAGA